jgi:hypothetical protein
MGLPSPALTLSPSGLLYSRPALKCRKFGIMQYFGYVERQFFFWY